jgi:hypothetical protein
VRRHDAADRQLLHVLELREQHGMRVIELATAFANGLAG